MKTTTSTFKSILTSKGARKHVIKIDLDLASGTTLHLTGGDIWEDSFSIDTASSGTSTFDIGTAVIGQCKFTLNNINGTFDNYDFFNAEATVWLGLDGDKTNNVQNYYRMGFYTVDEPSKANGLISLTLLDNMWKFDVPFSEAGVTFTSSTTARSIVNTMCSHCGVTLATQSFNGYDFPITQAPDNVDEMNCREMLQYIAMIGCNFCIIDDSGALNIKWYNTSYTTQTTVVFDLNQSTTFGTEDITITGVKFVLDNTDYTIGSSGYRLELENPLVNEDNVSSVLNSIWNRLSGFTLRTFNITTASDLSAEVGDRCKIKDYKGNYTYSWITTNSFKLAAHLLQCNAQPPNRTLVKRYSSEVRAAVEVARTQATELISTYDQSVQRMNKLVEQSMGAFSDYEESPNGGRIYYISNMPITKNPSTGACSFETGSIVFRMAGDVFAVSRDGGSTWVNGYDPSTGELVVNVLNAIGINAEWIKTGTLTVGGSTSGTQHPNIQVYDASDNLIVEINRFGITMHQGIISSPDYAEESGATYSTTGMKIDVLNKILRSPQFAIDSSGAYFKGTVLITGDIDLGLNSCSFIPAEYNIVDDFTIKFQAPSSFSGSVTYTISKTNGSSSSVEASGTITDGDPVYETDLDPLLNSNWWYEIEVSSGTVVRVSIAEATLAYVGPDGFKGRLQGSLTGSVYSDYGRISQLKYGTDDDSKPMMDGVFEYPEVLGNQARYIDFPNAQFYIGDDGGGGNPQNIVARINLSDDGMIGLSGEGNNGNIVRMTSESGGGLDIMFAEGTHGGEMYRSYSDGQGGYINENVLWQSDIQTSQQDSPPASLADGHLFLVYE